MSIREIAGKRQHRDNRIQRNRNFWAIDSLRRDYVLPNRFLIVGFRLFVSVGF